MWTKAGNKTNTGICQKEIYKEILSTAATAELSVKTIHLCWRIVCSLKVIKMCLILWIKAFKQLPKVPEDIDLHLITIKATLDSVKVSGSQPFRDPPRIIRLDAHFDSLK